MSEEAAGLVHPFNVWWMNADGSRRENVAGSYDAVSAAALAGQVFIALQAIVQEHGGVLLEVFDSSDTPIAFIGRLPSGG